MKGGVVIGEALAVAGEDIEAAVALEEEGSEEEVDGKGLPFNDAYFLLCPLSKAF